MPECYGYFGLPFQSYRKVITMPYRKTYEVPLEFLDEEEVLSRLEDQSSNIVIDTVWTHGANRYRIRGAVTVPYPEVLDRRKEFESYREIILYCTKKNCPGSKLLALGLKLLNVKNVKVYEGGIQGWMERGLPVEEYSDFQMPLQFRDKQD